MHYKEEISDAFGISRDLLHVLFGALIFLGLVVLLRRRKHALFLAFAGLALLQFLNEAADGVQWWIWTETLSWKEAIADTGLTLALPFLCISLVTFTRLKRHRCGAASATHAEERPHHGKGRACDTSNK